MKLDQFGDELIELIEAYCLKYNIASNKSTKLASTDTKQITLDLIQSGKDIEAVQRERGLTTSTIYNQLQHFVRSGELDVRDVLDRERVEDIEG